MVTMVCLVYARSGPLPKSADQFLLVEIRQQRLAVRRAIERHRFAGLSGNGDHVIGDRVVDEERLPAFADRQVRGLVGLAGQLLQVLARHPDQHGAPIVVVREAPEGGPENVILAAGGIGEKAAPLQRIGQAKDAAAVDSQNSREVRKRNRR